MLLAVLVVVTAVSCSSSTDSPVPAAQSAPPPPPPAVQITHFADSAAQTLHIPQDKPTIQAGVDALASGGTVTVDPGVYRENLSFNGKSVAIVGQGDPGSVVIDGAGATALSVVEGASPACTG